MRHSSFIIAAAMTVTVSLAGCASDGGGVLTTSSLPSTENNDGAKKPSPQKTACLELRDRISTLRSDGTVDRVEKAATGKTKVVSIKRASLSKVAELNAANAEYQAKCSIVPAQAANAAAPTAATTPVAATKATEKPTKVAAAVEKKTTSAVKRAAATQ